MKRVHIIAIGGSIMHGLAIWLKEQGYIVSGSDDIIFEPSKSRLEKAGLLPEEFGWFPEKISEDLDFVVVGMHAKEDNPEVQKALTLNLPAYSLPEFLFRFMENKQRIVIAGSYGKTTTTGMILHVLRKLNFSFDYLVGGKVPGFESNLHISQEAPMIVLEGDEYPSSRLDLTPKFHHYKPHILVITGIELDHVNIYKTEEEYFKVFEKAVANLPKAGVLIYNSGISVIKKWVKKYLNKETHYIIPYKPLKSSVKDGKWIVKAGNLKREVSVIGKHNMSNLAAALEVCKQFAITPEEFLEAISDFTGVEKRLQVVEEREDFVMIRDFAHSPAKVRASVEAVRKTYQRLKPFTAVLELHTYSSLLPEYIEKYKGTLSEADKKIIVFSEENAMRKTGKKVSKEFLQKVFGKNAVIVNRLSEAELPGEGVLLVMSSGNLGD